MYPWWLYVLPALITGIVAVVVQVVSALVTARRERTRLAFERERWQVELEQTRVRQFQSDKRERFFEYLPLASEYAQCVVACGEATRAQPQIWQELNNERGTLGHQLNRIEREIRLLAPELETQFQELTNVFDGRSLDQWEDEDERVRMKEHFEREIKHLEAAMRKSLGVEQYLPKSSDPKSSDRRDGLDVPEALTRQTGDE